MNPGERLDRSLDRVDAWMDTKPWIWGVVLALAIAADIAVFCLALRSTH